MINEKTLKSSAVMHLRFWFIINISPRCTGSGKFFLNTCTSFPVHQKRFIGGKKLASDKFSTYKAVLLPTLTKHLNALLKHFPVESLVAGMKSMNIIFINLSNICCLISSQFFAMLILCTF